LKIDEIWGVIHHELLGKTGWMFSKQAIVSSGEAFRRLDDFAAWQRNYYRRSRLSIAILFSGCIGIVDFFSICTGIFAP
jgi:hypothetical protein